ncbi:GntR family transcriptional regulator [Lewinella sp. W8]|uniref:GntR family transcriptional regulator n=1 Tax=Lewinella sp. W8 TaxID=2528208 RepID=UPI0010688BED|nr:GntR family transcriptional regulator [Lewinella sp. W8]MTB50351.1 GntR family transcriptional regulator [Lewinella sp. W8]
MKLSAHIDVDEGSRNPKYRQVADGIIDIILAGKLKLNDRVPSINLLSEELDLSRDTIEKAYNILKERGIITSVKGKGYYVTKTPTSSRLKILFLINKLSAYKMRIYNSFLNTIGERAHTNLQVYHCDESLFLSFLDEGGKAYDYYVIMPHFKTSSLRHSSATEEVMLALNTIPRHKLLILDNQLFDLTGEYAEVYQDFKEDIYGALKEGHERVARYRKLVIAYPSRSVYPYPRRILHGFRKFCVEAKLPFEVIEEFGEDMVLEKGTLYLTIPEADLVNLVRSARDQGLQPGKDIGIISYNETPLKDLLGITTVSTDFVEMGRKTAELLGEKRLERVKNPFSILYRDSL